MKGAHLGVFDAVFLRLFIWSAEANTHSKAIVLASCSCSADNNFRFPVDRLASASAYPIARMSKNGIKIGVSVLSGTSKEAQN